MVPSMNPRGGPDAQAKIQGEANQRVGLPSPGELEALALGVSARMAQAPLAGREVLRRLLKDGRKTSLLGPSSSGCLETACSVPRACDLLRPESPRTVQTQSCGC